jgi:hypothetical protein
MGVSRQCASVHALLNTQRSSQGHRCPGKLHGAIQTPPQVPGFSRERRAMKQRATGLLAGAAGLGTDTTVLVSYGMALAFCRTDTASLGAGHQLSLYQHRTRLSEA